MKYAKRHQGPPVDWEYWRRVRFAFPWEAAALSLGIEPRHLRKPEHRAARPKIDASLFTDADVAGEFRSRWNMLDSNVRAGTDGLTLDDTGGMPGENSLPDMALWLTKEFPDTPRELSEIGSLSNHPSS